MEKGDGNPRFLEFSALVGTAMVPGGCLPLQGCSASGCKQFPFLQPWR